MVEAVVLVGPLGCRLRRLAVQDPPHRTVCVRGGVGAGPGGDDLVPAAAVSGGGAFQQLAQGEGQVVFVLDAAAALGDGASDVLPGEVGERGADQGAVDPRHRLPPVPSRPAGLGQAHPYLVGSVRVVVDLPQAVRRR